MTEHEMHQGLELLTAFALGHGIRISSFLCHEVRAKSKIVQLLLVKSLSELCLPNHCCIHHNYAGTHMQAYKHAANILCKSVV